MTSIILTTTIAGSPRQWAQGCGHSNKLLKGSLVRWVLTTQPAGPATLGTFEHPLGYRLDRAASVLDEPLATVVLRAVPGGPLG